MDVVTQTLAISDAPYVARTDTLSMCDKLIKMLMVCIQELDTIDAAEFVDAELGLKDKHITRAL